MPAPASSAFGPLSTTRHTVNGVSFDMVRVPPGCLSENHRRLLVTRPFEIGLTPVTQALWRAVMGSGSSRRSGDDRPVKQVSWDEAQGFLAQLDALSPSGFRLPTEVEWAWAARCGMPTRWSGTNREQSVAATKARATVPVAGMPPSASGAFDISGNVWEWLQDVWVMSPPAGFDLQAPALGLYRVNRGGGWRRDPQISRLSARGINEPDNRDSDLGFRLFRTAS